MTETEIIVASERLPEINAIFTEDGTPRWFGPQPVAGSVPVDLRELFPLLPKDASGTALVREVVSLLVLHRRLPDGTWVPRPAPPPPTPEELAAAEAEVERQAAEAEVERQQTRATWIEQEIARRALPDMLLRVTGKITVGELNARVAVIRTEVEGNA